MTYEQALRLVHQGKYAEADEVIIEAIEKQIPTKPIEDGWLYCDICGLDILMQTDVNGHRYRFCPACGQKIDWSDEE